jgi:hypothetical protein
VEWIPFEIGGGFVAVHEPNSEMVISHTGGMKVYGKIATRNGTEREIANGRKQHFPTELVETYTVFGFVTAENGAPEPAVIRFWSTRIEAFRKLMTVASGQKFLTGSGVWQPMPLFAHSYRFTAKHDDKQKIYGWKVSWSNGDAASSRLDPNGAEFSYAVDLHRAITKGAVRAQDYQDDATVVATQQGEYHADSVVASQNADVSEEQF